MLASCMSSMSLLYAHSKRVLVLIAGRGLREVCYHVAFYSNSSLTFKMNVIAWVEHLYTQGH